MIPDMCAQSLPGFGGARYKNTAGQRKCIFLSNRILFRARYIIHEYDTWSKVHRVRCAGRLESAFKNSFIYKKNF